MQNLRWKIITILVVFIVFAAVGIYPIVAAPYGITSPSALVDKQLKLGLDLKGGVHLVLRVQTDDALRIETESEAERLREALRTRNIPVTNIAATSSTEFRVEGVPAEQDAAFREVAVEADTNFNRASTVGGTYTFTMKPNVQATLREEAVTQARQTIERRVNELGVTEPSIAEQGNQGDQILVQLPGVTDVNRAKEIIRSTGLLELKIVEQGPSASRDSFLQNGQVPQGTEVIPGSSGATGEPGSTVYYLVKRAAAVSGNDLRSARPSLDENSRPAVAFTLNADGARKFGRVTGENIGRQLAIVLDGRVQSAPEIQGRITSEGRISGSFTQEEVQNLSLVLRSGALPATLTYLEERIIGPSLGADSIRSGVLASVVGLLLIIAFMLIYYRLSGVNAVVALIFNLVILLGLMAYIGAVMTLPGIAGFVLTMGIGVDSNVLIFERIKEELEAQRGVRASINAGFSRVFWTLVDTHVAALISAAFLFQFGTGAIRGFAVTLFLGLISNLFTSIFVSKTLFEMSLARRQQAAALSHLDAMQIFKHTNYDFLRWRWHAVAFSWVVILAGVAVIFTKGIPRGIEFAGGTVVISRFDQEPSVQQVRAALDQTFGGQNVVVQTYGDPSQRQIMVRVPEVGAESGTSLSSGAEKVQAALRAANLGNVETISTEVVGPAVGRELTSKGIQATVLSLAGILLYIAFRYQLSFAVGAVVATLHDLLVTLAFLAFFQYDITLNVIAAILTVTGYSTNDTIVIFDRVRENLKGMRRDSLTHIINVALNQTLSRTIITAGTALLSALALFVFGGEVLRGFAFTMIVGIVTGTYSSIFVAAAIVTIWRGKSPTRAASHAPASVGAVGTAPQQPTRKSKPQRKARAS